MHYITKVAETLYEETLVGVAIVDKDGLILDCNEKFASLLEYDRSELVNKNYKDITHPEDVEGDSNLHRKCISRELTHYTIYKRYITKLNNIIWVKLKVVTIDGEDPLIFLSQIDTISYNEGTKEKIGPAEKRADFILFLQSNWKWFLGATLTVIGFGYNVYYEYVSMVELIKTQSERIDVIQKHTQEQDTQLREIRKILQEIKEKR